MVFRMVLRQRTWRTLFAFVGDGVVLITLGQYMGNVSTPLCYAPLDK
jgi:hypothetical protein